MEKPSLLDGSSDSDVELGINPEYAKSYDKWREQEVLQKLKGKYGDVSSASSSSSESEDDVGPKVHESFYKALSLVKSRDPKMYEINSEFFSDSEEEMKKTKEKKKQPMFLKDYERKIALETGGQLSDYEDEQQPAKKLGYNEEQEQIRKSFLGFDLSEDDDDCSDILKVRTKTKAEQEKLEEDYVAYLKGDTKLLKDDQDKKKDLNYLRNYWNDSKLDENEEFLKDYFLNARYEEDDKSDIIPTYEDITNDVNEESEEEAATEFEQKYNFRFEEPDSEFIKRYPRTMKDSLRKIDTKRKTKREEYTERKRLEKEQRREEIKYLKALKRKEIEEKLSLLRETLDDNNLAVEDIDVKGDFDPAEHDRKMSELFGDNYYDVPEEEKPSFPEDEELDFEDWDNWTGNNDTEENHSENYEYSHCEDPGSTLDSHCRDSKVDFQKEMVEASKLKSKKKKKSLFSSVICKKKPVFNPSDKSFEQYLNEYYKLDCEDFIGDLPTRFRYREVVPNDFGLSVDEILVAEDRELNQWCSLKKICQNRERDEELYDVQAYKKKAQNEVKKKKIFPTLYKEYCTEGNSTEGKTKKKKFSNENGVGRPENEESGKADDTESAVQNSIESQPTSSISNQKVKKKKKKKDKNLDEDAADSSSKEASSMQEIISNISLHKNFKRKYVEEPPNVTEEDDSFNSDAHSQKKKKKRKHNQEASEFQTHLGAGSNQFSKPVHQKKQSKQKLSEVADKRLLISDKRLEAYGINPKKFKNKIRFGNK